MIFDPQGKYGAYGAVDERKVTSSSIVEVSMPSGGQQAYRRMAISFSPLTYNQNLVERRALVADLPAAKMPLVQQLSLTLDRLSHQPWAPLPTSRGPYTPRRW